MLRLIGTGIVQMSFLGPSLTETKPHSGKHVAVLGNWTILIYSNEKFHSEWVFSPSNSAGAHRAKVFFSIYQLARLEQQVLHEVSGAAFLPFSGYGRK